MYVFIRNEKTLFFELEHKNNRSKKRDDDDNK